MIDILAARRDRIVMTGLILAGLLAFAGLADWSPKPADVIVGLWHDGHGEQAGDFSLPSLDDGSVYGRYRGSTGVPTTYLIDREGRI